MKPFIEILLHDGFHLMPGKTASAAAGARDYNTRPPHPVGKVTQLAGGPGNQTQIGGRPWGLFYRKADQPVSQVVHVVSLLPEKEAEAERQIGETLRGLTGAAVADNNFPVPGNMAVGGDGYDRFSQVVPDVSDDFGHGCYIHSS